MMTTTVSGTLAERMARFAVKATLDDLSDAARQQLKIRVLDALGCAIGAQDGAPVRLVRAQVDEFGSAGREHATATLIGGGRAAPDRAALYNTALVRYLDFNDSYLANGETCHPSDNLGAVLAAADYAEAHGRDFLAALATAYQVQCRLSDVAPVRDAGFDHVTQGAYAVAAGVTRALRLDAMRTANALAIAGTAFNALRVTRTGALSHWKGLAYPNLAGAVVRTTFLARRGVTGPLEVFEGEKGFMDAVAGVFELDWDAENLEAVRGTILKKYNAEIHSQSVLDAVLGLRERSHLAAAEIERVEIDVFDVAYRIIGGGEEGDKTIVRTKEQADHSLPWLVATALIDGQVMPEQYAPARINRPDVQALLRRVRVQPDPALSARFPAEMPCRVRVIRRDGSVASAQAADYPGFRTRGRTWRAARLKFDRLAAPYASQDIRDGIAETVAELENVPVRALTSLLANAAQAAPARRENERDMTRSSGS